MLEGEKSIHIAQIVRDTSGSLEIRPSFLIIPIISNHVDYR